MTTKPNNKDTSDYANNYFYDYRRRVAFRELLMKLILNTEVLNFNYKGRRISMPIPPKEDIPDYWSLMNAMDQKVRDMGLK